MAKIHEMLFELVDHPSYSPDLSPGNFFLFLNVKILLAEERISSDADVIAHVY